MIRSQISGLVQRDVAEVDHGLTEVVGVNGQEESGSLLVDAWRDDDSPVATTNIDNFFDGVHCHGVVRSFGNLGPLNKVERDPLRPQRSPELIATMKSMGMLP